MFRRLHSRRTQEGANEESAPAIGSLRAMTAAVAAAIASSPDAAGAVSWFIATCERLRFGIVSVNTWSLR